MHEGSCAGSELLVWSASTGTQPRVSAELDPGSYGFRARALDSSCFWFAEVCEVESIPRVDAKGQDLASIKGLPPNQTQLPSGCNFNPRCRYRHDNCTVDEPPLYDVDESRQSACHDWEEVISS